MLEVIKTRLLPFIVDTTPMTSNTGVLQDGESVELKALVHLPPRYHMLMRIQVSESSTVVRVKTDFWRVLAFLDKFFEDMANDTSIITK
jgi:AP-5 complex subunit beta-1